MLTAKGGTWTIVGLEVGIRRYLGKPFNPANCWPASHAVLPPCTGLGRPRATTVTFGPFTFITWAPALQRNGEEPAG